MAEMKIIEKYDGKRHLRFYVNNGEVVEVEMER